RHPPRAPGLPDVPPPAPPREVDPTHSLPQAETRVSVEASALLNEPPPVPQGQANPVYARGRRLCAWLQGWIQAGLPAEISAGGLGQMLLGWRGGARCRDPLAALAQFERQLARAPRARALLLDLARFFEEN